LRSSERNAQEGVPDRQKKLRQDIWKNALEGHFSIVQTDERMEERFPRFVAFENMSFASPTAA